MRARIGSPVLAALAVGLALALGGLAACGGKSGNNGIASADGRTKATAHKSANSAADRHQQELKFAKCMRDHGVDMPDPDPNGPITIKGSAGPGDQDTMQKAQEACKQYMPNGGNPPKLSPKDVAKLAKYSKCMRDHGIDMPDPDAQGRVLQTAGPASGGDQAGTFAMGPDNPQWAKADKACHSLMPKGMGQQ